MSSERKKKAHVEITDFYEQPEEAPETKAETADQPTEGLDNELQTLMGQLDEMKDKYLRALAEMENMKKRLQRDRENIMKYGNEGLLRDMLRIFDAVEKSVHTARELHPEDSNFIEGMEMVEKLFLETLKRHRVEPIDAAKGTPFNPNYHDAMLQRLDDEVPEPDMVVDEFEKGFMLNDRVLRPAKVSVSIQKAAENN
jgi:molecular chaperone GrpE